jgi:hypothetical protein
VKINSYALDNETPYIGDAMLPTFDSPDFEPRFRAKLEQCQMRCRFNGTSKDNIARKVKTGNLTEILRAVEHAGNAPRFPSDIVSALLGMVIVNVERSLATLSPHYVITDDTAPFADPEWEHLVLVYDILMRYQEAVPRSPLIGLAFLRMVLRQIGTRDDREQAAIVQVVFQYVKQSRGTAITSVFSAILSELGHWDSSPNYMFAATGVLTIATTIMREFPGCLKFGSPHVNGFLRLMAMPKVLFYRTTLSTFITLLISSDAGAIPKVLTAAIRFWPAKSAMKQPFFLKVFTMTLPKLPLRRHGNLAEKVFTLVADAIRSPSGRVCEAGINFLNDRAMEVFLMNYMKIILPRICEALKEAVSLQWNSEVRDMAAKALNALATMEPKLYYEVTHGEGAWNQADAAKMESWVQIIDYAQRNGAGVGNKRAEVTMLFTLRGRAKGRRESKSAKRYSLPRTPHFAALVCMASEPALVPIKEI